MIPFSHLLEAGVSGLVDAITALEKELAASRELIEKLDTRIAYLENTQDHHKSVLEDLTKAGVPSAEDFAERVMDAIRDDTTLEDMIDERIDSALSGREIEVNMTGTATL